MFEQSTLDAIRDTVDCRAVVLDLLAMPTRRVGKRYEILCPFHHDTHFGSCVVSEGGMKCFACGKYADAISLVQEVEGISFRDSVKKVAEFAGIETHEEVETTDEDEIIIDRADVDLLEMSPKTIRSLFKVNPVVCLDKMSIQAKSWALKYRKIPAEDLYPQAAEIVEARIARLEKLRSELEKSKKTVTEHTRIKIRRI